MNVKIDFARTREEKEAVLRLRYSVYTEEMHLYQSTADHEGRLLKDCEDEGARLLYVALDGETVGAIRIHEGRDGPLPEKYMELYEIGRFTPIIPVEAMAVFSRFTVAEKHRGGRIPYRIMLATYEHCLKEGLEMGFCDCVPSLVNLYLKLGWRKYLDKAISDPEFGVQIPLCIVTRNVRRLEAMGSPFAETYERFCGERPAPPWLRRVLDAMSGQGDEPEALERDWGRILKVLLEHRQTTIFEGLENGVVRQMLGMGEVIECERGQALIKAGTIYRNVFIVLEGLVEIRRDGRALATLGAGEVFGEMAFLLKMERSTDVYAASDRVRVVSLREQDVALLIRADSEFASRLFLNLSRVLCLRLIALHHLIEK
jgi:CRP/FNR family cyclic AMP-dependent transcriptional regulator